jgi:hypothetical protein
MSEGADVQLVIAHIILGHNCHRARLAECGTDQGLHGIIAMSKDKTGGRCHAVKIVRRLHTIDLTGGNQRYRVESRGL